MGGGRLGLRGQTRGGTKCTPVGVQLGVAPPHLLDILPGVSAVGRCADTVNRGKEPWRVVPDAANLPCTF